MCNWHGYATAMSHLRFTCTHMSQPKINQFWSVKVPWNQKNATSNTGILWEKIIEDKLVSQVITKLGMQRYDIKFCILLKMRDREEIVALFQVLTGRQFRYYINNYFHRKKMECIHNLAGISTECCLELNLYSAIS